MRRNLLVYLTLWTVPCSNFRHYYSVSGFYLFLRNTLYSFNMIQELRHSRARQGSYHLAGDWHGGSGCCEWNHSVDFIEDRIELFLKFIKRSNLSERDTPTTRTLQFALCSIYQGYHGALLGLSSARSQRRSPAVQQPQEGLFNLWVNMYQAAVLGESGW